jgi:hypothetical protein
MRVKSFDTPHKGLRNIISQFVGLAGQTDYADLAQLNKLKLLGVEMFGLLNDHVNTENELTLKALEEKVPGAAAHDLHDHELLEAEQGALQQQLALLNGEQNSDETHQFYLDASLFQSRYFEHIYHEETVTERLLQDNFTDEELLTHRLKIFQKIPFPTMLQWLKYIVPAQQETASVGLLSALKANAPKEAFDAVLATIQPEMNAEAYNSLVAKLSILK